MSDDDGSRSIQAHQDALDFMSSLGDEIIPQLLFSETLCEEVDGEDHLHLAVDVSLGGSSDGSNFYSVSVKRTVPRPGSDGTVETITAIMSPTLRVLEEKYTCWSDEGNEMQLMLSLNEGTYQLKRTSKLGQESFVSGKTFVASDVKGFVSEGSSFLLQRLLALQHHSFPSSMEFVGLDYNSTDLCRLVYRTETDSEDSQRRRFTKQYLRGNDALVGWESVVDDTGHLKSYGLAATAAGLVDKEIPNMETAFKQPSMNRVEKDLSAVDVMTLPGSLQWPDDMEMYSQYLDRKEELKDSHAKYMKEHPELKAILADFLQFLLLRKPDDVAAFAADFFSTYSARTAVNAGFASSGSIV